jgi:hypothetical protein
MLVMPTDSQALWIADEATSIACSERAVAFEALTDRLYGRLCRRAVLVTRPWPIAIKQSLARRLQRDQRVLHMLLSQSASGRHLVLKAMVTSALPTACFLRPDRFELLQYQDWAPLTYRVEWPRPTLRLPRM